MFDLVIVIHYIRFCEIPFSGKSTSFFGKIKFRGFHFSGNIVFVKVIFRAPVIRVKILRDFLVWEIFYSGTVIWENVFGKVDGNPSRHFSFALKTWFGVIGNVIQEPVSQLYSNAVKKLHSCFGIRWLQCIGMNITQKIRSSNNVWVIFKWISCCEGSQSECKNKKNQFGIQEVKKHYIGRIILHFGLYVSSCCELQL